MKIARLSPRHSLLNSFNGVLPYIRRKYSIAPDVDIIQRVVRIRFWKAGYFWIRLGSLNGDTGWGHVLVVDDKGIKKR